MSVIDPIAAKKAAIEKKRQEAKEKMAAKPEDGAIKRFIPSVQPEDAASRIRIIFDNSGSMNSPARVMSIYDPNAKTKISEAKEGCVEFMRNCTPNKDAVAIHLLNNDGEMSDWDELEQQRITYSLPALIANETITTDLILIASNISSDLIKPTGGTPLMETIERAYNAQPKATRMVAFSDGDATGSRSMDICYRCKKDGIPIDTVFFGVAGTSGAIFMQQIAEITGGIFLVFDPAKGVKFADAFKYLTPGKRLMLMDKSFKEKLERGEVK